MRTLLAFLLSAFASLAAIPSGPPTPSLYVTNRTVPQIVSVLTTGGVITNGGSAAINNAVIGPATNGNVSIPTYTFGPNLLGDPGFEALSGSGTSWSDVYWNITPGDGTIAISSDTRSGIQSVHVIAGLSTLTVVRQGLSGITPGNQYQISVWTHGDGINAGIVNIQDATHGGTNIVFTSSGISESTNWQQFSATFIAPSGCASVIVALWAPSAISAGVWYDDVSLQGIVAGQTTVAGVTMDVVAGIGQTNALLRFRSSAGTILSSFAADGSFSGSISSTPQSGIVQNQWSPLISSQFTGTVLPVNMTQSGGWVVNGGLWTPSGNNTNLVQWTNRSAIDNIDLTAVICPTNATAIMGVVKQPSSPNGQIGVWGMIDGTLNQISISTVVYSYISNYVVASASIPALVLNRNYILRMHKTDSYHVRLDWWDSVTGSNASCAFGGANVNAMDRPGVISVNAGGVFRELVYSTRHPRNPTLLCLGDSYTEGDTTGSAHNSRWCALLRDYLGGNCAIAGMGGADTVDVLQRLQTDLFGFRPANVIVFLNNDSDLSVFEPNISNIVSQIQSIGAQPILATLTMASYAHPWSYDKSNFNYFATAWIRTNAANMGARVVDMNQSIVLGNTNLNPTYDSGDGVHPTLAGHYAMYQQALQDLGDILGTQQPFANPAYANEANYWAGETTMWLTNAANVLAGNGGGITNVAGLSSGLSNWVTSSASGVSSNAVTNIVNAIADPLGSASASNVYTTQSTNGLNGALLPLIQSNSLPSSVNATNGLGTAAFKATGYFDISGAAQNATNPLPTIINAGISNYVFPTYTTNVSIPILGYQNFGPGALQGLAATPSANAFAVSGACSATNFVGNQAGLTNASGVTIATQISNATNGLGTAAFKATGYFDISGAAQNATNGIVATSNAWIGSFTGNGNGLTNTPSIPIPFGGYAGVGFTFSALQYCSPISIWAAENFAQYQLGVAGTVVGFNVRFHSSSAWGGGTNVVCVLRKNGGSTSATVTATAIDTVYTDLAHPTACATTDLWDVSITPNATIPTMYTVSINLFYHP